MSSPSPSNNDNLTLADIMKKFGNEKPPVCQNHQKFDEKWDTYIKNYASPYSIRDYKERENYLSNNGSTSTNYAQLFAELAHLQFHQAQELMAMTTQLTNIQRLLIELSELEKEHLTLMKEREERRKKKEAVDDIVDDFILNNDAKTILNNILKHQNQETKKQNGSDNNNRSTIYFKKIEEEDSLFRNLKCCFCNSEGKYEVLPHHYYVCDKCKNSMIEILIEN